MSERRPLEAYYTPFDLAEALVDLLAITPSCKVLEPHAGAGAFTSALKARTPYVCAIDLDPQAPALTLPGLSDALCGDFLSMDVDGLNFDFVVGNPPYSIPVGVGKSGKPIMKEIATEHILQGLRALRPGGILAYLLRASLKGSGGEKRARFWRSSGLLRTYHLSNRPSFTGGGTDNAEYSFLVFEKGYSVRSSEYWLYKDEEGRYAVV